MEARAGVRGGEGMVSEAAGERVTSFGLFPGAELWTGIKKGPPRKLKFPDPQEVVAELKKYLS